MLDEFIHNLKYIILTFLNFLFYSYVYFSFELNL